MTEGRNNKISCRHCLRDLTSLEDRDVLDLDECNAQLQEWLRRANENTLHISEMTDPEEKERALRVAGRQPFVSCKNGHKLGTYELLAESTRSETVPCQQCVGDWRFPAHMFYKAK